VRETFRVRFTCERANKDAACLPVTPMRLEFNSPVAREKATAIRLKTEHGWTSIEPVLEKNVNTVESVEFAGPFPEKTKYKIELPGGFADDAGREPENRTSFPLGVATDEYPPLVKFPGRFGILELNADPMLPVTVRSVEPKLAAKQVEPGAAGPPPIPGKSARMTDDESRIISRYLSFIDRRYEEPVEKELKRGVREGEVSAIAPDDTGGCVRSAAPGRRKADGSHRHPDEKAGLLRGRARKPAARTGAARRSEAVLRVDQRPRDESRGAHQARARALDRLGDDARRRKARAEGDRLGARLPRAGAFTGETDASGIADAGDKLPPAQSRPALPRHARALCVSPAQAKTSRSAGTGLEPGHLAVELQRQRESVADPPAYRQAPCSIARCFAPAKTVGMKHIARVPAGKGFRIPGSERAAARCRDPALGKRPEVPHRSEIRCAGRRRRNVADSEGGEARRIPRQLARPQRSQLERDVPRRRRSAFR
jgi:hypothetical protein